jgi:glycosyltransferase involved in cell wall biosynthesis
VRVLHILTDLEIGGAQLMALRLVETGRRSPADVMVIGLKRDGALADRFLATGASTVSVGVETWADGVRSIARLRRQINEFAPDVVQTWMYHADVIGGLSAVGVAPVVWNLRQTAVRSRALPRSTRAIIRGEAALSYVMPARIVCCSEEVRVAHAGIGYRRSKLVTIENGFDTETFRPRPESRARLRVQLGLDPKALVVGHVARLDPEKDHTTWLKAFALVRASNPDAHAVLVGPGLTSGHLPEPLASLAGPQVHLLGARQDISELLPAFDLFVSSSRSEGFPNAVGEAMASSVPCVVTDAGASAHLVGETGIVVPVGSVGALADAVGVALAAPRPAAIAAGERARARIVTHFSLSATLAAYERLYEELAERPRGGSPSNSE